MQKLVKKPIDMFTKSVLPKPAIFKYITLTHARKQSYSDLFKSLKHLANATPVSPAK